MQKAIWALAIVCCLSTITLTVAITHADSPPTIPEIVKARAFQLVNEKGESMATLAGENWLGSGFCILFGKENDPLITLTRSPNGTLMISSRDGRGISKADLLLDTDGSSNLTLSRCKSIPPAMAPELTAAFGIDAWGPYMRFKNDDGTYLEANTHDGVRLPRAKMPAEPTTKSSMEAGTTTKTSKE